MKNRSEIVKTGVVIERILDEDTNHFAAGEVVLINGIKFAEFDNGCGSSMILEIESDVVVNENGWEGVDEDA